MKLTANLTMLYTELPFLDRFAAAARAGFRSVEFMFPYSWAMADVAGAGNIAPTLAAHLSRIRHIQIADNPGRHQPGTGELNFPFLFAELEGWATRGM